MLKKLFIVVVCLVTVCAVLGLNDRLDYDGLTDVFGYVDINGVAHDGMISGNVNDITDDFTFFAAIGDTLEYYSPTLRIMSGFHDNGDGTYTVQVGVSDPALIGPPPPVKDYTLHSESKARQLNNLLNAFTQEGKPTGDGVFDQVLSAVHYVAFWTAIIGEGVMTAFIVLFDITDLTIQLIYAPLYLIGLF